MSFPRVAAVQKSGPTDDETHLGHTVTAGLQRQGGFWMSHPNITARFGCHTYFKILLEVPQPNSFSSNLDELED